MGGSHSIPVGLTQRNTRKHNPTWLESCSPWYVWWHFQQTCHRSVPCLGHDVVLESSESSASVQTAACMWVCAWNGISLTSLAMLGRVKLHSWITFGTIQLTARLDVLLCCEWWEVCKSHHRSCTTTPHGSSLPGKIAQSRCSPDLCSLGLRLFTNT